MPGRYNIVSTLIRFMAVVAVLSIPCHVAPTVLPLLPDSLLGSFDVGFTTLERFDYSRTFRSPCDYFGNRIPGEIARPLQVCIWYPAEPVGDSPRMVYGENLFPYPGDTGFFEFVSRLQDREIVHLHRLLRGDGGLVLDLLSCPTRSVRDAPAPDGTFPHIVYLPDWGRSTAENVALFEYLASHGFVVAALHSLGTHRLDPEIGGRDLETLARDLEFALSALRDLPFVDRDAAGLMGHGGGGLAALIVAMRHTDIRALVNLQASGYGGPTPLSEQSPSYAPDRVLLPIMQVGTERKSSNEPSWLEAMEYCDRYIVGWGDESPATVTHYHLVAALSRPEDASLPEQAAGRYEAACRFVLKFFDAYLRNNQARQTRFTSAASSGAGRSGQPSVTVLAAAELPPSGDQLLSIIRNQGVRTADSICRKFDLPNVSNPLLPENTFNEVGYAYLQRGQTADALEIFRFATQAYPHSVNVWDSYAEAALLSGDSVQALQSYRKAMETLPNDTTTAANIKEWIRSNVPNRIRELEGAHE